MRVQKIFNIQCFHAFFMPELLRNATPASELQEADGGLYLPPATFLHRCDPSAGCCWRVEEACGSRTVEHVQVVFKDVVNDEYKLFTLTNHTSCVCQNKNQGPR